MPCEVHGPPSLKSPPCLSLTKSMMPVPPTPAETELSPADLAVLCSVCAASPLPRFPPALRFWMGSRRAGSDLTALCRFQTLPLYPGSSFIFFSCSVILRSHLPPSHILTSVIVFYFDQLCIFLHLNVSSRKVGVFVFFTDVS